jgi:hypothetical protein
MTRTGLLKGRLPTLEDSCGGLTPICQALQLFEYFLSSLGGKRASAILTDYSLKGIPHGNQFHFLQKYYQQSILLQRPMVYVHA